MKNLFALFIFFLFITPVFAQTDDAPQPDRWRGLVIDAASPDDAIAKFGKPKADKITSLPVSGVRVWLTKEIKNKKFRMLAFKKVGDANSAVLGFLDDKLVFIVFETKDLAPSALSAAYGIDFSPNFDGVDVALSPENFERTQGKIYPKNYPATYDLIGVAAKTFICAGVSNAGFSAILKQSIGVADSKLAFPGKVLVVQIVSRTLENRDNINQLK